MQNYNKLFSQKIQNYFVKTSGGMTKYINLDNAATTPPFLSVQKKVDEYLDSYGSVHRGAGAKSKISTDIYESSREYLKKFVNAPSDSYVIFSGNTTGAMNLLAHFFSFLKGKIAVSEIEHSSSWLPWIKNEGEKKLKGKQFSLDQMNGTNKIIQQLGRQQVVQYNIDDNFEFDLKDVEKVLKNNKIKALVLTASSNATGYCPDIKKIGQLAHKHGAMFVVDACQFIQHHPIDMKKMGIDFLAVSGHKFYAPYGGGFLIGPKYFLDKFLPYQIGGGNLPYITSTGEFLRFENQMAHDPGTPNAIGAVAMAEALKQLEKIGLKNIENYERELALELYDYLSSNAKVELYMKRTQLSSIISFNIIGVDSRIVAEKLNNDFGIGVRAGSFCVYNFMRKILKTKDEKKIIKAVKCGNAEAVPGFIRASFSLCNTKTDVQKIIQAIEIITK